MLSWQLSFRDDPLDHGLGAKIAILKNNSYLKITKNFPEQNTLTTNLAKFTCNAERKYMPYFSIVVLACQKIKNKKITCREKKVGHK